eukprot:3590733-Amphidinium_carterae.1
MSQENVRSSHLDQVLNNSVLSLLGCVYLVWRVLNTSLRSWRTLQLGHGLQSSDWSQDAISRMSHIETEIVRRTPPLRSQLRASVAQDCTKCMCSVGLKVGTGVQVMYSPPLMEQRRRISPTTTCACCPGCYFQHTIARRNVFRTPEEQ